MQVIRSKEQPEFPKWKTNELSASSSFDPEYEDTKEFMIGPNEFLMHSIDDSFEAKGGFVLFLDMNQEKALSDKTKVFGYDWSELKFLLYNETYESALYPNFEREIFIEYLNDDL